MSNGKFIVLYGINNLGKTLQTKKLVEALKQQDMQVVYLKYPIYNLEPTGPMINEYLRKKNPYQLTVREIQSLYTQNRLHYQSELIKMLSSGIWVVAEDYIGTGIAWGGESNRFFLERLNSSLIKEDIAILFDGKRFSEGIEKGHRHEGDGDLIDVTRTMFYFLANIYGWPIVNANQTIEKVHSDVWEIISQKFNLSDIRRILK